MALAAASLTAGCGTVCGDAVEVCGLDPSQEPDDCSGATECASFCIVDWDGCDVNNPEKSEAKCIAECLEAAQ